MDLDLVGRVRRALADQPVDPAEFERCVCALLQPRYPGLSAVEGGHDFGRDADIYSPFGDGDSKAESTSPPLTDLHFNLLPSVADRSWTSNARLAADPCGSGFRTQLPLQTRSATEDEYKIDLGSGATADVL